MFVCNRLGNLKMINKDKEIYNCFLCGKEIFNKFDNYSGRYWVKCVNRSCKLYNKITSYIDMQLYKEISNAR